MSDSNDNTPSVIPSNELQKQIQKIIADRFPIQKKETNAEKQVDKKNIAAQLYLVGSISRLKLAISYLLESLVKADKKNDRRGGAF